MVWLQGLLCGAVATLATSTALLLAMLLAPGLFSLLLDRGTGKPVARTMLLFGASGCVEPLRLLWSGSQTTAGALMLLADARVVGAAWLAAGAGWLVAELAPVLVRVALEAASRARANQLRAARARYEDEWELPSGVPGVNKQNPRPG